MERHDKERGVLALMAERCSNAAIAQRLFITEKAASKHTTSIFTKLAPASPGMTTGACWPSWPT